MDEKISLGMDRIKRRSKTVDKTSEQVLEISQPGLWVELATYQQDIAKDPSTNGHETYTIDDPATAKPMQAVWVPKNKSGYFEGKVSGVKRLKMCERIDDDSSALRGNQLVDSFRDQTASFKKSLPQQGVNAKTLADVMAPQQDQEAEQAGEDEEAMLGGIPFDILET